MSRKTRNLIWSVPLVAVLAVVGALAIFVATAPSGVFADETLGKPGLNAPEAEGPRSIKLTWTAPEGATPTSYRIDVSKDAHVWSELVPNHSGTEYVHTLSESDVLFEGTQPIKTERYYRIFALNSHGPGDESEIKLGDTKGVEAPEPVEKVTATATGPNSIKVTWEAPMSDGGMSITEYRIVQSLESSGGTDPTAIMTGKKAGADVRSITIDKLSADTQYYFRVYAKNKVAFGGVGVPGDASTRTASRPDAPSGLVALQSEADNVASAINLYWHAPARNGGRSITDYIVEFKVNTFEWQTVPLNNEADSEGDVYPTNAETPADYAHSITSRDPGDADDGGLLQGDRVRYRVYAKHADETSRASGDVTLTIIDTTATLADMDGRPLSPEEVMASASSDTPGRIEVSWTHDIGTGYRIDYSEDGMTWHTRETSTNLKLEPLTSGTRRYVDDHDDLNPGDTRYYRVFASKGGRFGLPGISNPGMAGSAEAPAAPASSAFTAKAVSATQINLDWSEPTSTGGRDIRRYLLEIRDSSFLVDDVRLEDVGATLTNGLGNIWVADTEYEHKMGLTANTRYYYRLRSDNSTVTPLVGPTLNDTNEVGTITPVKDAAQQSAKTNALARPAAPHSLSAHQGVQTSSGVHGDQGVYLTWLTAKASGGPAEEYEIMRVVTDEDDLEVTVAAGAGDSNARTFYNDDDTQDSLDNKARRYRVRAMNEAGASAWTDWLTYPLAVDHTHLPTSTELTKPDEVMAESNAVGELALTWEGGANADSYLLIAVNMADTSDYETVMVTDGAAQMGTVTGLTSGVNYLGIVVALQGTGADRTYTYGASGVQAVQ